MVEQSYARPTSFRISPFFILSIIIIGICTIEVLLVARFGLHLTAANASEGISTLILEITGPLVAPFSEGQVSPHQPGSVDRAVLLAAIVYLIGAVCLMGLTLIASALLAANAHAHARRQRDYLQRPNHSATRLVGTANLDLSPRQAERALKMLRLDSLTAELFVIPASGGCIVAAFSADRSARGLPLMGRLRTRREAIAVKRAFRAIEQRFHSAGPAAVRVEAGPKVAEGGC